MATRGDIEHRSARLRPDAGPHISNSRAILQDLFGPPSERTFAVRFWDGTLDLPPTSGDGPAFTLVLRHPGALRRMLLPPTTRSLGEAYIHDDIEIDGDLEAATAAADRILHTLRSPAVALRIGRRLWSLPARESGEVGGAGELEELGEAGAETGVYEGAGRLRGMKHSRERDSVAVRYHYDTGNEFYALWLDRHMQYSEGWFRSDDVPLDAAQEAKLDLMCRALRLQAGERLIDIGCGWGGLIRFAARRYGVSATGITLSPPQAEWAAAEIEREGLEERCRVEVRDYRDLPPETGFDKAVSVGMIEHVGAAHLEDYFRSVSRLLRPGGLFLNSGIVYPGPAPGLVARVDRSRLRHRTSFIAAHVFPDGELVTPSATLEAAEAAGFELRHATNWREHYARTCRHWTRRLEARKREALELVGRERYRVWRLYTAGSAHGFAAGKIAVLHLLLAKPRGGDHDRADRPGVLTASTRS